MISDVCGSVPYVCNIVSCYTRYYTAESNVGPLQSKEIKITKEDANFYLDKLEEYYNLCEYANPNCARAKTLRILLVKAGML